jgi:hypothetical protein
MEEQLITNDDTTCEPAEEPADEQAPEAAPDSGVLATDAAPPSLEEMVRGEVERRLAEIFPAKRETPRNAAAAADINSEDRLRLGYGSREPHT